jgi:hypothetical protein
LDIASDTRTRRTGASPALGPRDEDKKPRRGGSLARDQPTSSPIETLKRPCTACFGTPARSSRGETRHRSRQGEEGETPGGLKNPRRGSAPIVRGNTRRPEYGLPKRAETPEGAPETGCVLAHDAWPLYFYAEWTGRRAATRTTERARTVATVERCSGNITERASVDTQRQEGQGVPRGVPAIGRENLWRVNPRSAAGTKQDRQGDGGNKASSGRGSRKTQHSRARQARRRSLPATSCAVGARNPRRGKSTQCAASAARGRGRSGSGHTLEQSEVHERIWRELIGFRRSGARVGRPRRPASRGAKAREGSSTHATIPRTPATL